MSISQYKEKSLAYKQGSVPIGLLTYPLLQAADILAYKANDVLVGSDQLQHMSVVREAVESFNKKVGTDYFPLPEWVMFIFL
jgi:tryptophanyl-tRNA synthetase